MAQFRETPYAKSGTQHRYIRSFLVGAAFTVAWTPCLSPILGSVLTLALIGDRRSWRASTGNLFTGDGAAFPASRSFFSALSPLVKRIGRFSRWIYFLSGALLAFISILILLHRLNFLYL